MQKLKNQIKLFYLFSIVNIRHYWWYYLFISIGIVCSVSVISYFQVVGQPGEIPFLIEWAYWFFLNVGIANITASGLGIYGNKNARIHLLTLPVPNWIRVFALYFYTILLPFAIFTIVYTLVANTLAGIFHSLDFTDYFSFIPFNLKDYHTHFITFLILQSVLLLIGSFFTKVGVVKTVLCIIAILLVIFIIDSITASYSVDKSIFWNVFTVFDSNKNSARTIVGELPQALLFMRSLLGIALIPVSIYIVYLRIKELEV